jgi:hypothetical protein
MIRFIGSTYGCKLDHFSRFLELLLFPWCHNSLCPPALHPTCMLVFSFFFYSSEAIPSHEINRLAADLLLNCFSQRFSSWIHSNSKSTDLSQLHGCACLSCC